MLNVVTVIIDEVPPVLRIHGQRPAAPERELTEGGGHPGGDKRFQRIPEAGVFQKIVQPNQSRRAPRGSVTRNSPADVEIRDHNSLALSRMVA